MKTMGLSDLRLVRPARFPDPEAETRATGAVDVLAAAQVNEELAAALAGCVHAVALSARQRDLGPGSGEPRTLMPRLVELAAEGPVALVFGNETSGLTNDELLACQSVATIPTVADFSSLNLGSAVQVLCYEARLAAWDGRPPVAEGKTTPFASAPATHDEIEGLHGHLAQVMTDTGFFNPQQPGRLLQKLRRLFARAGLERDEVNILRGILAATQQKTGHGRR